MASCDFLVTVLLSQLMLPHTRHTCAVVAGGVTVVLLRGAVGLNIQKMFLTGKAQYPVERTLLVTGALDSLMISRHAGGEWERSCSVQHSYPASSYFCLAERRPANGGLA